MSTFDRLYGPPVRRIGRVVAAREHAFPAGAAIHAVWTPVETRAVAVLTALASVVCGVMWSPVVGVVVVAVILVGSICWVFRRSRAAERLRSDAAPEVLAFCARELRAGASPLQALRACAETGPIPLRSDLEAAVRRVEFGDDFSTVLSGWNDRPGSPELSTARVAMRFGLSQGGSATVLDSVAVALRSSLRLSREVRALTAQARLSAQVLAALPIGFILVSELVGGDQLGALTGSTMGRVSLTVGLVLEVIGAAWLWKLATRLER